MLKAIYTKNTKVDQIAQSIIDYYLNAFINLKHGEFDWEHIEHREDLGVTSAESKTILEGIDFTQGNQIYKIKIPLNITTLYVYLIFGRKEPGIIYVKKVIYSYPLIPGIWEIHYVQKDKSFTASNSKVENALNSSKDLSRFIKYITKNSNTSLTSEFNILEPIKTIAVAEKSVLYISTTPTYKGDLVDLKEIDIINTINLITAALL